MLNVYAVRCPQCSAKPRAACKTKHNFEVRPHAKRYVAANQRSIAEGLLMPSTRAAVSLVSGESKRKQLNAFMALFHPEVQGWDLKQLLNEQNTP